MQINYLRFDNSNDDALTTLTEQGMQYVVKECAGNAEALEYATKLCGTEANILLYSSNRALISPTRADVAKFIIGKDIEGDRNNYDIIVVGAGPAGMTTGIYASRGNLAVLILEQMIPGGLMTKTEEIENYPGFAEPVNGFDLSMNMEQQAKRFGTVFHSGRGEVLVGEFPIKTVVSGSRRFYAPAVVLTLGTEPRRVGIPGEDKYYARGVSYCATCDGPLYRNEDIFVIGGGDSAIQEALFLAKLGKTVTVVHRRDELRAAKVLQERAFAKDNLKFLWNSLPVEVIGDESGVTALKTVNKLTGEESINPCRAVFIFIGLLPKTEVNGIEALDTDEQGFLISDAHMETNVPGVFAAGDVRAGNFRQIATAVGDGAIASHSAENHINNLVLPELPETLK